MKKYVILLALRDSKRGHFHLLNTSGLIIFKNTVDLQSIYK